MDAHKIVEGLRSLQIKKGAPTVAERKSALEKLRDQLVHHEVALENALKEDLGKGAFESFVTEVGFITEELKFTLKHLSGWTKHKKVPSPLVLFPGKSFVKAEPYGITLIIAPWNYPFQLSLGPLIGAVAAGNRVVLKTSEYAAHTSKAIKNLVEDVFTKDEVVVIEGAPGISELLLKEHFDYIFFTGSTPIGKVVMEAASKHLTPLTLELGGKSPCLIDGSADIDLAAKRCAWGKFLNSGQTCVAPDYVLVPRKEQDEFIEKLQKHLKVFFGEQIEKSDYARIINHKHFDRLAKLAGSHLGAHDRESRFMAPVIIKDASWSDEIMGDEIFGPILPIIPYDDQNQAIFEIMTRSKPLAFYVFSSDIEKGRKIMEKVSFGGGCLNDTVVHLSNPHLPFGGVGASGMGSYHGLKSFETFTHYKSIFEQSTKVDIPMRYPPYSGKLRWLKFLLG